MTDSPAAHIAGILAENPERCHACYRLIQAGEMYYLTVENARLWENCIANKGAIRVASDLVVAVDKDRLAVRRGDASVVVLPSEVWHLVDEMVGD